MADNSQANPGAGGDIFATDDIGGTKWAFAKVAFGPRDTAHEVEDLATKRLPVQDARGATPTVSRVLASVTSVVVLAANALRVGATIYNDSVETLKLKFGVTAAAADFTVAVFPDGQFAVPGSYSGRIDGIWGAASGAAQVTEWV